MIFGTDLGAMRQDMLARVVRAILFRTHYDDDERMGSDDTQGDALRIAFHGIIAADGYDSLRISAPAVYMEHHLYCMFYGVLAAGGKDTYSISRRWPL